MRSRAPDLPEDSPLREAIASAIAARGRRAVGVRVSITPAPEWFEPPDGSPKVWVKWMCWRLTSRRGFPVTKAVYGVLHGGLTDATLLRSLRAWFPGHECVVDHEIDVT